MNWSYVANEIKVWLDVVQSLLKIFALVLGALWVWTKFVLERGLLPPSQMDVALRSLGSSDEGKVVEVAVRIRNKGAAALIVSDLRVRLRYLTSEDTVELINDQKMPAFGRVNFHRPHAVPGPREIASAADSKIVGDAPPLRPGEYLVVPYDTFVQHGVAQAYTFVTSLPVQTLYLLVRASFRYEMRPTGVQLGILKISRRLGMIQYSLRRITEPHTVEKCFNVSRSTRGR
jgi:hypothetical protein